MYNSRESDNKPFPQCVGCGYCCRLTRCASSFIAEKHLNKDPAMKIRGKIPKSEPQCPFLYWNGERYRCFLAKNKLFAQLLAIGEGCTSSLNTERLKYGPPQEKKTKKP